MNIPLSTADKILREIQDRASEGAPVTAAVVNSGGNLVALARMDGAILGSLDAAIGKAYTSCATRLPTAALSPMVQPGQPLFQLEVSHLNPRPFVSYGGGVPIAIEGQHVGGLGVSGGTPDQDHQAAQAAIRAVLSGDQFDHAPGPGERGRNFGVIKLRLRFNVNDYRAVCGHQQVVRHVPAPLSVDHGTEQERLRHDTADGRVKIRMEQAGQLKSGFVRDVAPGSC